MIGAHPRLDQRLVVRARQHWGGEAMAAPSSDELREQLAHIWEGLTRSVDDLAAIPLRISAMLRRRGLRSAIPTALRQATSSVMPARLERIDHLLDGRLDREGAHSAECGCWECRKVVSDVLARRHLGEMLDPRDRASTRKWGTAG